MVVKPWNSVVEISFLMRQYFENITVRLSEYVIGVMLELLKLLQFEITEAHPVFSSFGRWWNKIAIFFLLEDKNAVWQSTETHVALAE